jgi:hypothetical protein
MTNSLGSFDPNVLPMDAFTLGGAAGDTQRKIGLKAPWIFGDSTLALRANASIKWTTGLPYTPGDVVYHDEDGLVYMNLAATSTIEPDYSDVGVEGTTWKWVEGAIGGFVSGRGWWTKFADRTLIQYGEETYSASISDLSGSVYRSSNPHTLPDWPIEFYSLSFAFKGVTSAGVVTSVWGSEETVPTVTSPGGIRAHRTVSTTTTSLLATYYGIGRWEA